MAKKYTVVTEHILKQSVQEDQSALGRAKRSLESFSNSREKMTKDSLRNILNAEQAHANKINSLLEQHGPMLTNVYTNAIKSSNLWANATRNNLRKIAEETRRNAEKMRESLGIANAVTPAPNAGIANRLATNQIAGYIPANFKTSREEVESLTKSMGELQITTEKSGGFFSSLRDNVRSAISALRESRDSTNSAGEALGSAQKNAHSFFNTMKRAAVTVPAFYGVARAILAVHDAIGATAAEFVRFDQSIFQLQAVLNLSKDLKDAEKLAFAIEDLGVKYGGLFEDIQKGMLTLGRAGIEDVNDLIAATETLNQLSLLTGDSMEDGAAVMATLLNVYPELSGEVENLGNKMGYVANATRLGLGDFSTISNYALTTAKSLNITSDAYLALTGAMSKVGLNASTIGTNIRRLKELIDKDSEGVKEFFRVLGIKQEEFARQIKAGGAEGEQALVRFSRALNLMSSDTNRYAAATAGLDVLLKGTIDTFKEIGAQDYLSKMLVEVQNETYNLEDQTKSMTVGIVKAYEKTRNAFISMFNQEAKSTFDKFFDRSNVENFDKSLNEVVSTVRSLIPSLETIAMLAGAGIFYKLAGGALSLAKGLDLVAENATRASLALKSIKNPYTWAGAAAVGVAALTANEIAYRNVVQQGGYASNLDRKNTIAATIEAVEGKRNLITITEEYQEKIKQLQSNIETLSASEVQGKERTIGLLEEQIAKYQELINNPEAIVGTLVTEYQGKIDKVKQSIKELSESDPADKDVRLAALSAQLIAYDQLIKKSKEYNLTVAQGGALQDMSFIYGPGGGGLDINQFLPKKEVAYGAVLSPYYVDEETKRLHEEANVAEQKALGNITRKQELQMDLNRLLKEQIDLQAIAYR